MFYPERFPTQRHTQCGVCVTGSVHPTPIRSHPSKKEKGTNILHTSLTLFLLQANVHLKTKMVMQKVIVSVILGAVQAQMSCSSVKSEYQSHDCCDSSSNNVSTLHFCASTAWPVQWTKVGIIGSHKSGITIAQSKETLRWTLNEGFKTWYGKTWSEMQTQAIQGVPEVENNDLEVSVSSHTVNSADWEFAQRAFMFPGCNPESGADKDDAVDVCVAMYNDPTLTTHTIGSCTMTTQYGPAFGIDPTYPIDAFHYDEWLQVHESESQGMFDQAWRDAFKQNTYVYSKCKAMIAASQWTLDPMTSLGLVSERFEPRIVIYGGATDLKKANKIPCVS